MDVYLVSFSPGIVGLVVIECLVQSLYSMWSENRRSRGGASLL